MKKFLFSPQNFFSPFYAGVVGATGVTFALMLYAASLNPVPRPAVFVWVVTLIVCLGAGMLLQRTTARVFRIKEFFALMAGLGALACGYAVTLLLAPSGEVIARLFVGAFVFLVLAAVAIQTYFSDTKASTRPTMPHGDFGVLDNSTGTVDPSISPQNASRQTERWNKTAIIVRATLPIVAALSMWLVRSLPATGDLVLIVLCGSFFAVISAIGVGRQLALAVSCRRWEKQHQMEILVKRT